MVFTPYARATSNPGAQVPSKRLRMRTGVPAGQRSATACLLPTRLPQARGGVEGDGGRDRWVVPPLTDVSDEAVDRAPGALVVDTQIGQMRMPRWLGHLVSSLVR
jgi:hypothetical protein